MSLQAGLLIEHFLFICISNKKYVKTNSKQPREENLNEGNVKNNTFNLSCNAFIYRDDIILFWKYFVQSL